MKDLKKLTEEECKEITSIKETLFNALSGELDITQYELLEIEVNKLRTNGFNTAYFDNFLNKYAVLYELRKEV